jgi:hypothetical protein
MNGPSAHRSLAERPAAAANVQRMIERVHYTYVVPSCNNRTRRAGETPNPEIASQP